MVRNVQYGLDSWPPRVPGAYWMFSHLSAVSQLIPQGCPSSHCIQRCKNGLWHVAAKAVWFAGEYFPSLTQLWQRLPGCLGDLWIV